MWWTCGVTPAVEAAIALSEHKDPMSLKLERVGGSHSHLLSV